MKSSSVPRRTCASAAAAALAISGAASGYLGALTLLAWRARWTGRAVTARREQPSTPFLVLIPAHDEERLIGSTVRALLAANYPAGFLEVHVVADNCSDDTVAVASSAGATVHEHRHPGGKGAALQWALTELSDARPDDVVAIIDADTVVDPDLFGVLDAVMASGYDAVQSHYAVLNQEASTAAALRAAALSVRHYLRPLARSSVGGSCGLFGNGMAFRHRLLATRQWSSHLTEDVEFHLDLLLDGHLVGFAPDGVVRAEMPDTLAAATTQNERWERGRIDLAKRYALPLLIRRGPHHAARADAAIDLLIPPFSALAAMTVAATALGAATGRQRGRVVVSGVTALAVQACYLGSGLAMTNAPRAVYLALLRSPRTIIWKLSLWMRVLLKPGAIAWHRTERNAQGPQ